MRPERLSVAPAIGYVLVVFAIAFLCVYGVSIH